MTAKDTKNRGSVMKIMKKPLNGEEISERDEQLCKSRKKHEKLSLYLHLGTFCMAIVALAFLLSIPSAEARHHPVQSEDDEFGGLDPDEIIESVCTGTKPVTRRKHMADLKSMETCPHTREDVTEMMTWGFDIDEDGFIDKNECEKARDFYLNWWEKPVMESCDTVFDHCDCDGDGKLSAWDINNSVDTCLRNCDKVMLLMKYVKERVKNRRAFE